MTILDRVKELTKEKGYSLTQVNDLAGFGTNVLYSWKTRTPSVEKVKAVADVLNVSVDYLLGNTDDKNPIKVNNDKEEIDLKELTDIENIKHRAVSFGGEPMTDHDAKLIQQYLETLFEGR